MKEKVLVIGLDGATFDLIMPWMKKGELPNLKKFKEKGIYGNLESTVPPLTGPAWSSFMTGKTPGKIGVFDFVGESGVVTSQSIKDRRIWDIIGERGKRSVLVNIPVTYPPRKINGFVITGLLTPSEESGYTYPEKLKEEIGKMYSLNPDPAGFRADREEFVRDVYKASRKQFKTVRYLLENKKWDFFMFVLSGTDFLQHFLWKAEDDPRREEYMEELKDYFMYVDGEIGKTVRAAGKGANVILMSDHGFGATGERVFWPNRWLKEEGYLKTEHSLKKHVPFWRIYNLFSRIGLGKLVKKLVSKKAAKRITDMSSETDKSGTKVFFNSAPRLCVFKVNKNIVNDYEDFRRELMKKLRGIKDPENGKCVFKRLWKAEDIYNGAYRDRIGDVVCYLNPEFVTRGGFEGPFTELDYRNRITGHKMNGIFMAKGPHIKKGKKVDGLKIFDLAPTILDLLNVPVPRDMDGRVLKNLNDLGQICEKP